MKKTLVCLALMTMASNAYAEVAGKGVFCSFVEDSSETEKHKRYEAYAFNDQDVVQITYRFLRDKYTYGIVESFRYYTDAQHIRWVNYSIGNGRYFSLHRRTLELAVSEITKAKCSLYSDFKSLKARLEAVQIELTSGYESETKENKF